MLKRVSLTIMLIFLFSTFPALAADTPAKVKAAMDKAGLKVYPGAVYCTGQIDMGARFATSDSTEKVREWYRKEYPEWSAQEKYGSWAFYDGPPDQGMPQIMSTRNMTIQFNELLPDWHSLPRNMTTEILMASPQ